MNDKAALLNQLKIDRDDSAPRRGWIGWLIAIVLALGGAAGAYAYLQGTAALPVGIAVAEPVSTEVAMQRGSMLDASGYVVARRQATVSSKITGKVIEVLIEEGQQVERDQVVARLDATNARAAVVQGQAQLEQARANLNQARVAFENAAPIFERNREQFTREIISAQTFDTAKGSYDAARTGLEVAARAVDVAAANLALAERSLDDTVVRAPFAGVVTVKAAQEGEMVSPVSAGGGFTRTGIGTIVDMDSLEVEVDVSENFINRVRPGQDVTVKLNAYPDWSIPAEVVAIIPTADRAKATVRVRVGLGEKDERILPQMGVRVSFLGEDDTASAASSASAQRVVRVPSGAVRASGDTGVVFLVNDDTLERRAVRLGAATSEGQVVTSGLLPGARVAVGDLAQFSDGLRVRVEDR
jgi:RND family efflux transporter MFP subunit